MISRVADHCLWFGRYLERAEASVRVLFVTRNLALDAELPARHCWGSVLIVSGEEPAFVRKFGPDAVENGELVQRYLTWDEENLSCIRRSIAAARDNARSIREVISLEIWETINELYLWVESDQGRAEYEDFRHGFYRRLRASAQLCLGYLRGTMLHDPPLDFIWLGVQLERAGQTSRFLDVHHHAMVNVSAPHQVVETALWLSILRACSGFEPFVKRHRGIVTGEAVAKFLIYEPAFPRSVAYTVRSALRRLSALCGPEEHGLAGAPPLERLKALDAWLAAQAGAPFAPSETHVVLTHVVEELASAAQEIARDLLGYGPPTPPPEEREPASTEEAQVRATGTE
jgi:uncharacterized alpha-E superfamily protein